MLESEFPYYLIQYEIFSSISRMKPDKNKDEDPGTSMMKLMQKMYDDGDDDMKRTIKKAWHESQEKKNRGEF